MAADASSFGDLLRRHRAAAGLTQEALAECSGVSVRAISDLERGLKQRPQRETVRLLGEGLGLSPPERTALQAASRRSARPRATPSARSSTPGRVALPTPPTPFLGRVEEVARIVTVLRSPGIRLVTLTGPGGVGKTRLAIAVAAQVADAFPDGVVFVDLSPVRDPALVLPTIAGTLAVKEQGAASILARLVTALAGQRRLLVLDNLEQVIGAAPDLARVLDGLPELTILATSRARLALRAEHELPVPPLATVDPDRIPDLGQLAAVDSIRLFVSRAQTLVPDFTLTVENAPPIATICRRLDGLPLAIELAVAQVKLLSPAALVHRLERHLPALVDGPRDAPDRQRTLHDAIAWSVDLLAPPERTLFRRLAVFVGGWTLEAADAVANSDGELDVFAGHAALVDTSLVRRVEQRDGAIRFRMLETIREFALERLTLSGETERLRAAHARHVLAAVERLQLLELGAVHADELNWLETEHANVRVALAWFADRGEASLLLRLVGALWPFWYFHTHLAEGRVWLTRALSVSADAPPAVRAGLLHGAGQLAHWQGDDAPAIPLFEAALALWREEGDRRGAALTLLVLGVVAQDRGDYAAARRHHEESAALYRADGATAWAALAGAYQLGKVAFGEGDYPQAKALLEESLRRFQAVGNRWGTAISLVSLGHLAHCQGSPREAADRYADSLAFLTETGSAEVTVDWLNGVAALAAGARPEAAARLFGIAAALAEALGYTSPLLERTVSEPIRKAMRSAVGDARFAAECRAGRAFTLEQALAEGEAVLALLLAQAEGA